VEAPKLRPTVFAPPINIGFAVLLLLTVGKRAVEGSPNTKTPRFRAFVDAPRIAYPVRVVAGVDVGAGVGLYMRLREQEPRIGRVEACASVLRLCLCGCC
jgi:hypothetical protein